MHIWIFLCFFDRKHKKVFFVKQSLVLFEKLSLPNYDKVKKNPVWSTQSMETCLLESYICESFMIFMNYKLCSLFYPIVYC